MYGNRYCLIFSFIVLLCGCPIITWEELTVECSINPVQDYFFDEYIKLDFSLLPDRPYIEEYLQLKLDGKKIETAKEWTDRTLLIKPLTSWKYGKQYQLFLEGSLRMDDGRMYAVRMQRYFIYGEPRKNLQLLSISQDNNSIIENNTPIVLQFNKAVRITSFNEQFTVSPYIEKHTDFSADGTVVTITPKNGWSINTIYSWSAAGIVADDGYPLDKEYTGMFSAQTDTVIPELKKICPVISDAYGIVWQENLVPDGNVRENQPIGFIFTKPMKQDSIENGITFSPAIKGFFKPAGTDSCRFLFYPEENYQIQKRYRISVTSSVQDTAGLKIYEPYNAFFTCANGYVQVDSITMDSGVPVTSFPAENVSHTMQRVGTDIKMDTTILFSTAIGVSERVNAVKAVSLNVLFPSTAQSPSLESVTWNTDGTVVTLYWKGFTISSANITNYYKLLVSGGAGGVKNNSGEYMEEDVCVVFSAW